MKIIVIAGGEGTRMAPLKTHKTTFPFMGKTMVEHILDKLDIFQAEETIIVANPIVEKEIQAIAKKYGVSVSIQKPRIKGMAGAVLSVKDIDKVSTPILIVAAVTSQEMQVYKTVADAINKNSDKIVLAARHTDIYKHGGYFKFDKKNNIEAIIEKPGPDNMPSNFFKTVLDYFPDSQKLCKTIESTNSSSDDIYEVALTNMLQTSESVMTEITGDYSSLKYPNSVLSTSELLLNHYLKKGISPDATISKTAKIVGEVQIEAGAKIMDFATIVGPSYIGKNVVVGNGALVRESMIEEGCQVGYGSEVARSYLGPATKGHMMYVGDSIIEGSVNLSAGTVLANYRFDHKVVKITLPSGIVETGRKKFGSIIAQNSITGVNTSLMPGTVLGSNVTIGSGCTVKGFIPDDSVVKPNFSTYDN